MIYKLKQDNINKIDNSFIDKKMVLNELKNNPFANFLLYEENNEIIGYIYYSDIYDRVEINQFEIKNIHRNCGKGDLLLKKFIKIVDKDITLEVREDNEPAIRLYLKNNFNKTAIRKGYYKGIDGILMERKRDSI